MALKEGIDEQVLAALLQPVRRRLNGAAVVSIAASMIWPVQAALAAWALAGLLGAGPALWPAVAAFALAGSLRAVLTYHSEGMLFGAGLSVITSARTRIVHREALATDGMGAGAVAALAGEKLDALLPYITRYAPARGRVMVVPLVILMLAFWQSWAMGLVLLITGPLIPIFMALVGMAAKQASQRQMAEVGSLNDLLVERLAALVDIRLLGAGKVVSASFAGAAERLQAQTMAVLRVAFLSSAVLELFAAIGVAMVAVYVGFDLLGVLHFGSYSNSLTPEAGLFLLLLAPEFYQPMRDLSAAWHDKAAALAVAGELASWEATKAPQVLGQGTGAGRLAGAAGIVVAGVSVRMDGLQIAYPDFTVTPGQTVAVVGPSGAGKSTLLRLLAGMEVPDTGSITVAGQGLTAQTADGWRARLGWMPQAPHFLNASLLHNLTFGRGGDVGPALRMAGVNEVVDGLPAGLATRLGETGGGLSGGEARRLTLARAIQAKPDVLLADEPTADLDEETARQVTEGLMALAATGCSLIIATHDERLAARMDVVIRIGGAM
jgi:ATP-binding cassette subfamily C protein CydD